ncbi:Adhesion G protein-coupled receptor L3 [Holothuria leucospilota]|uniref:Adhesion G protein-coupled receptor L3 n=1 Tax=Holothuria leucospilota TaxID=206669 RepID=A0A9Q1CIZ4_HOLLE|nr:Adhesion G protein-coupled receptor L3 [Holothuria leucospilota]
MIGICPLNWEDDVIRRKCEDVSQFLKEKENLDLSDPLSLAPVVGAGNVTFRNSFCAICHSVNIMALQAWEMEINCPESAIARFKTNSSDDLSNLGSNCKVLLKPPKGVTHLAVLPCFPHETTSQCKIDMSPTIELAKGCETYLAPICGSDGVVYKNPQCMLCNYASNTYPLGYRGLYCLDSNELLSLDINPSLESGRFENIVPLSIVFDFSSRSGVRLETEGFVYRKRTLPCNRGQIFDPFQGSCITFACTEGYKLTGGKCIPTYTGDYCKRSNSTPDGVITISFTLSSQSTLEIVNQHAQLCITDLLAMPLNSLFSRETSNASLLINGDSVFLSQGPQNIVDIEFMVNFKLTNVLTLLEKLIAFQTINQSTAFPLNEMHEKESITMKQVCDAISRIRFEYGCEEITELECPMRWTRESEWSVKATNGTDSVYFPQSQHSIVLTDTNLNVDISFNGRRVTNFSSSAIYCKSLECPTVILNASLFDIVLQNGKAHLQHVILRNFTVPEDSFELLKAGLVKICSSVFSQNGTYFDQQHDDFFLYSQLQTYISTVGLCLSVVCLSVTMTTYLIFPTLRKAVSNKLIITFCFMLSFAQISLLVLALPTFFPIVCTLVAITSHYSWLVTFLSTTMLGFDLNQAFAWAPMTHPQGDGMARFLKYLSICFGLPCCIVIPFAVIHFVLDRDAPFSYGSDRVCWISNSKWNFYVLGIPLGLCMAFNLVFFVHTIYAINNTRKQIAKINDNGEKRSLQDLVFLKVSSHFL